MLNKPNKSCNSLIVSHCFTQHLNFTRQFQPKLEMISITLWQFAQPPHSQPLRWMLPFNCKKETFSKEVLGAMMPQWRHQPADGMQKKIPHTNGLYKQFEPVHEHWVSRKQETNQTMCLRHGKLAFSDNYTDQGEELTLRTVLWLKSICKLKTEKRCLFSPQHCLEFRPRLVFGSLVMQMTAFYFCFLCCRVPAFLHRCELRWPHGLPTDKAEIFEES